MFIFKVPPSISKMFHFPYKSKILELQKFKDFNVPN